MKEILLRQIEKQLETCEEIIELAPDAAWSHAPKNAAPFAGELYHLIDGIRLYLDVAIEGGPFEWDRRYLREDGTVNWSRDLVECHTKDEMRSLLESVRDRIGCEMSFPVQRWTNISRERNAQRSQIGTSVTVSFKDLCTSSDTHSSTLGFCAARSAGMACRCRDGGNVDSC